MLTTTNLPCVQGSESEFCPYSGDVGDQFSANLDSSDAAYYFASDSSGLALHPGNKGEFRFPNEDPLKLAAAIERAVDQLKSH
jgi:hypothetical protein